MIFLRILLIVCLIIFYIYAVNKKSNTYKELLVGSERKIDIDLSFEDLSYVMVLDPGQFPKKVNYQENKDVFDGYFREIGGEYFYAETRDLSGYSGGGVGGVAFYDSDNNLISTIYTSGKHVWVNGNKYKHYRLYKRKNDNDEDFSEFLRWIHQIE